MKITWLGESGFLLEDDKHALLIDPYFSDALGKRRADRHRLLPVKPEWLNREYDMVLFTHCHIDHTDPETTNTLLERLPRLVLAGPPSSREVLGNVPYWVDVLERTQLTLGRFHIRALPAIHSDRFALGYEICHEGQTLYFSGDTALLCGLADRIPKEPDAAFLCFNAGVGKNMDAADAVHLAKLIRAKRVIPCHYGLLPDGAKPETFTNLLKENGIAFSLPKYGETFVIESGGR